MLSFATEIPVIATKTSADFLSAVKDWLLGSPHTVFVAEDLSGFDAQGDWSKRKSNEALDTLRHASGAIDTAAVRYSRIDKGLEWVTTLVFSKGSPSSWIGIRTTCESQHPSVRLPIARKPVFVKTFLNGLGGGNDGELVASLAPRRLGNSELPLAARCIASTAGCRLPVVYVSSRFRGGHSVRPQELAEALAGMAHVVVEPNRAFSIRLMPEVSGQNVYGGSVGIYWPDSGGRRSIFPDSQYESAADLESAVVEEVRRALVNRRPHAGTTWASVQELVSRERFVALRNEKSTAIDEYVREFDKELSAKQQAINDAELEISRLQAEVRRLQLQAPMQSGFTMTPPEEQDLYEGEIRGIVCDALADAISRVPTDSRRQHVLESIVKANPSSGEADAMRSRLKSLLRDYRSMDAKTRAALQDMGFEIIEEGKHIKAVFQGDDRYTFSMPKSGSDSRGGLNLAGDIARLLL